MVFMEVTANWKGTRRYAQAGAAGGISSSGGPTGLVGPWRADKVPEPKKNARSPDPIVVRVSSTVAAARWPIGSQVADWILFF